MDQFGLVQAHVGLGQGVVVGVADGLDFTAIFAANDIVAAGVYLALHERGLSIPRDVSVVRYDDVPVASDLEPALTTVRVPLEELGRVAVRAGLSGSTTMRIRTLTRVL